MIKRINISTTKPQILQKFAFILLGTHLFILILQVQPNSVSSRSTRRSHGEPCNRTLRCNAQSWLSCDRESSTCLCAKPDEMLYNAEKEKCEVLVGERCKYGFDEHEVPTTLWYEKAECVEGATCEPSGICSCPDGFYEDTSLQRCSPLKGHGLSCADNNECDNNKFLGCFNNSCQCDPDKSIYNRESYTNVPANICVGRVGSPCNDYYQSLDMKYCIPYSYCIDGFCKCHSGYAETSDRLCGLGYNGDCSSGQVCSDKLRCTAETPALINNEIYELTMKCECSHPTYQEFDSRNSACAGFIGAPCSPHDSNSCVKNAVCVERDNMFQCECDQGFIENELGKCDIAYGYVCQKSLPETCDVLSNLQCKESNCVCENDVDIYEGARRQCSRPVGVRCKKDEECVTNSRCLKPIKKSWGRCSCIEGYTASKIHTCISEDLMKLIELEEEAETEDTTAALDLGSGENGIEDDDDE